MCGESARRALICGAAMVLHGCGAVGASPSPGAETTTPLPPAQPNYSQVQPLGHTHQTSRFQDPLTVEEAVDYFNKEYMGYDFMNPQKVSPLGVTISWANVPDNFHANLFCDQYLHTGCYKGFSDCRMSASLFNWKICNNNYIWATTFGRSTGFAFNQSLVETTFNKCSYMFDGATENRLNNGCGLGAHADCADKTSAFYDVCPSTGYNVCTADDVEVTGSLCEGQPNGKVPVPYAPDKGYQCFFSGPALNYPKFDKPNALREMVAARMKNELERSVYIDHNEVILDERVLMQTLQLDPVSVIPAFVFAKSRAAEGRAAAEKMSESFSVKYGLGEKRIPVIGVNDMTDFRPTKGPFFVPDKITSTSENDVAKNILI